MLNILIKYLNYFMNNVSNTYNTVLHNKLYLIYAIFLIIVLTVITYFIYNKFIAPNFSKHVLNKEYINKKLDTSNDVIIMLFFTEWCPYCKSAMPEWNKFNDYVNKANKINNFKITLNKIDCDKDEKLANKYNIEAYPSIRLLYKGEIYTYDAKPNKKRLVEFLKTFVDHDIEEGNGDNILKIN